MNTNSYKGKRPTTLEEQLSILESRNLIISDKQEAVDILSRVNYYRLSAYMLTLKCKDRFNEGTTFRDVYDLYEFDQRLRNSCLSIMESIEIAFRTHISYALSHKYGPTCYCDHRIFSNRRSHELLLRELKLAIDKSHEQFINHHKNKYDSQFPIWVVTEVASFSLLSRFYSLLKPEDMKEISETYYLLPYTYLQSWMRSISVLRNICAHYGRLYNRNISIKPKLFKQDINKGIEDQKVFGLIYIMGKICMDQKQWVRFVNRLKCLIEEYEIVDFRRVGFPANWEEILLES